MMLFRSWSDKKRRPPAGLEALDDPTLDPLTARATLEDISKANRYLGGRAAVDHGVRRILDGSRPSSVTVLDVGAGAGDVLVSLEQSLAERGVGFVGIAVDWHREAAAMARAQRQAALVGDATALPLGDRSVDIVVASQLLHHYSTAGAIQLVRELHRVARVGVVIADLRRATLAMWGIWLASLLLRFHPVSRTDGVVSVRRGFSAAELADVCRAAGMSPTVRRRPGYRLVAFWRTDRVHD